MDDPDLKLAASYYHLYNRLVKEEESKRRDYQADKDSVSSKWQEDEWTDEDTAKGEAILLGNKDRCSAVPPGTSNSSIVGDRRKDDNTVAWDHFYDTHKTSFFKDRHYFEREFPNEFKLEVPPAEAEDTAAAAATMSTAKKERTLVEVGCGVGNALLPLLEESERISIAANTSVEWTVYGLDLSGTAIDLLQRDERFRQAAKDGRAHAFCCDLTKKIPTECTGVADVTSLLFCLSAIDPQYHVAAALHVAQTLSDDGGVLVFRDYGRYDEAQLKLGSQRGKLLRDNFYRKHDGTKCYYFTTEDVQNLFCEGVGLEMLELRYLRRMYRNRSTQETRRRVWVQGRFRRQKSAKKPS